MNARCNMSLPATRLGRPLSMRIRGVFCDDALHKLTFTLHYNVKFPDNSLTRSAALGMLSVTHTMPILVLHTCPKNVSHLMFDINFGNCGPTFKILSPGDSWENSLCTHHKISTSPAICCYTTLWKSKIQKCYWLWQHLNRLLTCSWGHFEDLI